MQRTVGDPSQILKVVLGLLSFLLHTLTACRARLAEKNDNDTFQDALRPGRLFQIRL